MLAAITATALIVVTQAARPPLADAGAPAFLHELLGSPDPGAPFVPLEARTDEVTASLKLEHAGGTAWQRFDHGVARATSYGAETIVVKGSTREQFLTVNERQGQRTWRWRLDTNRVPRVGDDGAVALLNGKTGTFTDIYIAPVEILDVEGEDVTPLGLQWGLERTSRGWWLTLSFDDAALPLPYIIDPAFQHRNSQTGSVANGSSLSITKPVGTTQNDLLVVQVVLGSNGTITATGWTPISNLNSGPSLRQATYYKIAGASEPASYSFTWTGGNAPAVGGITAYYGVKSTSPADVFGNPSAGNNTQTATASPIIPTTTGSLVIAFFSSSTNSSFTQAAGTDAERWDATSTGPASGAVDDLIGPAAGTSTSALTSTATNSGRTIGVQAAFKVDDVAPTVTLQDPGTPVTGSITLQTSAASDVDSYVASVQFQRSPAGADTWTNIGAADTSAPYSVAFDTSSVADGLYDFRAVATDAAGNTGASTVANRRLDNAAPILTVGFPASGGLYNAGLWNTGCSPNGLCGTASDGSGSGVQKVQVSVRRDSDGFYWDGVSFVAGAENWRDNTTFTAPDWSYTFAASSLGDGTYTIHARAIDNVNLTETLAPFQVTYDNTAPDTSITAKPTDPSNSSAPSFSFTSPDASASFECRLDGGAYAACSSPKSYSSLVDGSHTFDVRAEDSAGNVDASPDTWTWTVDTTAPDTSLTASPSNPSNDPNPSFSFSSSEAGSFECKLDGGSFAACTSPKSYAALAAGSHTFEVRATDGAGNTDGSPASYTWTIDLTAPNTSITASPADPSNDPNPSFSFNSSEAGSFECKLDAGSFAACTSPKSYASLTAGSHTFEVRATDGAGNTDASPASHTWTIDLTDPTTSITASPSDPSNEVNPSFSFSSNEGGSFQCQLDAGGWGACTSPKSYTALAAGSHTFEVRATDAAGNTDATPASHPWTIDLTDPPAPTIDPPSPPEGANTDAAVDFYFSDSEAGVTFRCRLDAASFGACSSPKSYSGLGSGSHTFEVKATDAAGNESLVTSRTWSVSAAPDTTITVSPADPSNEQNPSFSFTSSDAGSTFECKLDAGSFVACTSPKSYSGLAAGSHTFEVRAIDPESNVDPTPASYTWTIDLAEPNTSITAGPSDPSNNTGPSFSFSSSEGSSSFQCQLDTGGWSACTSPKGYAGLTAGSHTFEVRATDAAGNTDATPASHTWTIDLTDPATSITASPADPSNEPNPSLSFSSSEAGTFECKLDAGSFTACTSPKSYSGLAAGAHTFEVRATDAAGNTDASPASHTWTIDLADPNTSITASPADPSNDPNPSFSFTSSEAGSSFECKLDAGSFAFCTSPKSYSGLAAGSHTFEVRATDAAGNTDASSASYTWTIDLTDPATSITASPADPSNEPNPSFSFSSSEAGTFECKLDAGPFASCTSPKSYSGLAAGSHTFEVRATDAAGNTDATPASYPWTIDLTEPTTSITAGPADPSNDANPSFGFSSSEAGTFECKLDAGPFASCTSPKSYSGLAAGSHTFEVRAIDAAGNTDASPASDTWTIDLTLPNTSITVSPADPSNDANPSFSFDSSEAGTFECKLDAGSFASCSSPKTYSGLAAGSHTFEVRATDAAGNTDATPASYPWTIDLTVPNTSITVSPADPSNDANPSFSFSASEGGSSFQCQLDTGGWSACTSPKSYAGLTAGSHTFEVRATDAAGNTDATPASHPWTIDLTDPNTSITVSPSDPSNEANPSFSFSSSETGTFECKLDAGSFAACSSPKSYSGLAAGAHTFEVRASDAAGNTDATPATHTWTIDLTHPNTSITAGPPDPSNDINPSFSFSASETGTFECKLDAGSFAACTSPKSYSGLSAGSHTFEVRATDVAGNTDATPATHTWTIDLSAPDTTITSQPGNPSNDNSPTFAFSASEEGSTFECELDGGGFQLCASPHTYAGPLADGPHTFRVRATDAAGNTDATAASFGWTVDSVAPATTIDAAPSDPSNDSSPTFEFSSSEAGSSFECELDAAGFQSCASPHTYAGPLADGPHTFRVRATDPAGNADATPAAQSWTVNAAAPNVTITSPSGFVNASASDPLTVTATSPDADLADVEFFRCSDSSSDCSTGSWVSLGADSSSPYTGSWPLPGDGNAALRVVATDVATSTGSHMVNVTVDRALPVTTIGSAPNDPSASAGASFTFAAGEPGVSFECRLDGGAFAACTSPLSYGGLVDGGRTFDVRATDPAGNVGPADSHAWTIDTLVPDTTLSSTPSDPSTSPAPSFSFTSSEGGSTFQCELDGSGFAACVSPKSYAGLADGSHTFSVQAVDAAGNTDATPASFTWTIDSTAPGDGLVDPGSPLRASVTLSATPSDAGAGVREVAFEYSPADAGSWTALGTDMTAPFNTAWDTSLLPDGLYDLRAIVTDNASNVTVSPEIQDRRVDNTAPTATMNDPGAYLRATVNLTSASGDSGSGIASVSYERSPAGAATWSSVPASWDTVGTADGLYDLRVVAADAAGNTTTSAAVVDRRVDNTAPSLAGSTPADGALVAAAGSLVLSASEDVAAIQNASIDGAPAPAPVIVGPTVTYTMAFTDGPHTLAGELEDPAGNRRAIRIHFTVWSLAAADYPYVEKNWLAALSAALAATNGAAEVNAPANGWSGGAAGDWLVLRADPRPPTPVGNGFELNGDVLDVTAYWALAGGEVHSFLLPIHVVLRNGAANALPMTLENGAWRGIPSLPSGQTLPGGWQDGFYRVGSDVHILTRHLSSFSLLRDAQGPRAPGSFRGAKSGGRLRLSWTASTDNSGMVAGYAVYANGAEVRALGSDARSVDLGAFKASDGRKFQLAAKDAAGNVGAKTHRLVICPSLRRTTLATAKSRLAARGLRTGKIIHVRSSSVPAGRIVRTGRAGVIPSGAKVALIVSLGRSGTSTSGSTGGSGSGGRGSSATPTSGLSGGNGNVPSATPTSGLSGGSGNVPSATPPTFVPTTPPTTPDVAPPAAGESDKQQPALSVTPTSSSSDGSLRRILGLALLSAAFAAALIAWWRLRRLPAWRSPAAEPTEIVFWDQRLTRLALATVRRVAGRL